MVGSVLVAMSGGVDSSVAASRLVAQGWNVTGVHLKLAVTEPRDQVQGRGCCTVADAEDARRVAERLEIPFYVWDLSEEFRRGVMDDFVAAYAAGRTPNPCARCNERVKLVPLLARARSLGFDALATGHYARVRDGRLYQALDAEKDQSYVLYMLRREQLSRLVLPLGASTKKDVRAEALELGLAVADKPDSVDICFVPGGDTGAWLQERLGPQDGEIVDHSGTTLGRHRGVFRYTVGQRRGLGLSGPVPRYVLRIEPATRRVVTGTAADLRMNAVELEEVCAVDEVAEQRMEGGQSVQVRLRAHGAHLAATGHRSTQGLRLDFSHATAAIAPGQVAVVYSGDEVLGGGIVARSLVVPGLEADPEGNLEGDVGASRRDGCAIAGQVLASGQPVHQKVERLT